MYPEGCVYILHTAPFFVTPAPPPEEEVRRKHISHTTTGAVRSSGSLILITALDLRSSRINLKVKDQFHDNLTT